MAAAGAQRLNAALIAVFARETKDVDVADRLAQERREAAAPRTAPAARREAAQA